MTGAQEYDQVNYVGGLPPDARPHVKDRWSKKWILLDTGATVTVWPKAGFRAKPDPEPRLAAANGSPIRTYGQRTIKLNLGGIRVSARVTLADVRAPMIGWDWFQAKRAQIIFTPGGDDYCLAIGDERVPLAKKTPVSGGRVSAMAGQQTFQHYSQQMTVKAGKEEKKLPPHLATPSCWRNSRVLRSPTSRRNQERPIPSTRDRKLRARLRCAG